MNAYMCIPRKLTPEMISALRYDSFVGQQDDDDEGSWHTRLGVIVLALSALEKFSDSSLYEELQARLTQTRCGCTTPACKRCQDDARTLAVLAKARGEA